MCKLEMPVLDRVGPSGSSGTPHGFTSDIWHALYDDSLLFDMLGLLAPSGSGKASCIGEIRGEVGDAIEGTSPSQG